MVIVPGTGDRPLRVGIIGGGPSGFYAAEALFKTDLTVEVDVYDALPAPFGLVRYGVAPDHAKIKSVIKVYEKTAARPGFEFFGNVTVGRDISVEELRRFYDAVVFTCGAQTDRRLGIPGEDMPGSYTATEFVAWYNGHPDYVDREFDLSGDVAVIIGQGNVAVDVARILSKTRDELKSTDITAQALDVLAESRIRDVHMIGRRGPVQAAFTPQEIKEFGDLEQSGPVVEKSDLEVGDASRRELEESRQARKNFDVLQEFAAREATQKARRFRLQFLKSPKELLGNGRVERVCLEKNELTGEPGRQRASGTGEMFEIPCGTFFRSVGYRGMAIAGVPFDEGRGVFPNEAGRVVEGGDVVRGLYVAGWIKRGPSGIIGTNKPDSIETIKHVVSDIADLEPCSSRGRDEVVAFLRARGVRVVSYDAWRRIDAAEVERGKALGKPREKFVRVSEMLEAAGL